ncbi:MAG: hypothetical protein GF416_04015 [Candidatus Altiarchaeales archaeon]|nr:hypothetical protein [Candidatus Altiarchaeales archaeon]MBD3416285.1 hypothetical protein [Candidatus Altiarchaeales archaeon]
MDEPTDRSLKIQGLTREEYDSLSDEGKSVIAGRSRRLGEYYNITLAAELLNAILDEDPSRNSFISEALEGRHPSFEETVRDIIRDYMDANVNSSIKDYYKIKYSGQDIMSQHQRASAGSEAEDIIGGAGETRPPSAETAPSQPHSDPEPEVTTPIASDPAQATPAPSNATPATPTSSPEKTTDKAPTSDSPIPPPPHESPTPSATTEPDHPLSTEPSQTTPPATVDAAGESAPSDSIYPEDRRRNIASILAAREGRDSESVLKTEEDVIDRIMAVTDENRNLGLRDEDVCRACEEMIKDTDIEFFMEALMPGQRQELIRRAQKK